MVQMEVPAQTYRISAPRIGGYLLTALGLSVLVGWIWHWTALLTVIPNQISMKANTAIGFLCAGLALLLITPTHRTSRSRAAATGLAIIVIAVGLLSLVEYLLHRNLGIDQLFFADTQFPFPGRMAPITTVNFCLAGSSLLLLALSGKHATWAQLLSLLSGLSALLAIIGYLYGVPLLYGSVEYTSMALNTGIGFLILSVATVHCHPSQGMMAVFNGRHAGSWLSRWLLPVAIIAPAVLGGIYLHSKFSLTNVRLALACLMVSQIVLFVILIWVLAFHLSRSERDKTSASLALEESEKKYRAIFEEALIGIFQTGPDGHYINANPAMATMLGYDSPEELFESVTDIAQQLYVDPQRRQELTRSLERDGVVRNFECQLYRKDRRKIWVVANLRAVRKDGFVVYEGTNQDITERKQLEAQLIQAQKMEAVGRLAGGVAHDFNNAIGVIVGYSALLQECLPPNDNSQRYAEEIGKAGHRAAALTRQLLAFSRKQVIQPTILDLNAVVAETEKMLCRLIGEDIEMVFVPSSDLGRVKADLGQIGQILMNLAVNARDAMPQGGRLLIETANAELDAANLIQQPFAKPGRYVMLSVSDTGSGIDKDTQAHIFEPFFTTKAPGQGTGLGLSTVYGIVKQSEGYVWVYSELGKGARFKIYLPRVDAAAEPISPVHDAASVGGAETILLVEDDDAMRELTRSCLEGGGYVVLSATNAESAIDTATAHNAPIHLLVTDVVMPGISGPELAKSLSSSRPETKVLYMSGYAAELIAQQGILDRQISLLDKPFTKEALLRKVRQVLDGDLSRTAVVGQ
jgi:two-component system, cell cycle sensor histidine kinase and response regulator CckA